MPKLFGTDGVRGVVGVELTSSIAIKIGMGVANVLVKDKNKTSSKVIIGIDGRESCDMLVSSVVTGLNSLGVSAYFAGIIPTPAISYLVKYYGYDAGIMITASHNSYEYNGIKIFDFNGHKLADDLEDEIEKFVFNNDSLDNLNTGNMEHIDVIDDYINYLINLKDSDMSNLHIAIDTANGATSVVADRLFSKIGINYQLINNIPNGKNINDNCGALYPKELSEYVVKNKLDGGVSFDGDGDRAIFVDEKGNIVDGDYILAIISKNLLENNKLNNNTIVGTIVSNLGLIKFCKENNIEFIATKVGDRYVLEEINNNNLSLGGEQSGHIIIKEYSNAGDGLLTSIIIFNILASSGKKFSELSSIMKKYPQITKNVHVYMDNRDKIYTDEEIINGIESVNKKLEGKGRVIIRPSGTEPLIRIMIEGEDINEIEVLADEIVTIIESKLK